MSSDIKLGKDVKIDDATKIGIYSDFNGIPNDGNLSLYAHDNCEIKKYSVRKNNNNEGSKLC